MTDNQPPDFLHVLANGIRRARAEYTEQCGLIPCEFCGRPSRGTAILPVSPYTVRISCGRRGCGDQFQAES